MKKRSYNLVILAIYCICVAACGDGTYQSNTYFENRSGHKITVEPYGNKLLNPELVVVLSLNETKRVMGESGRGTALGSTYGDTAGDSIVVTFDDTIKISHVGKNKAASPKSYVYEHPRNILNRKNYTYMLLGSNKKFTDNEYRYIFTAEDYQDALRLNK